MLRKYQAVFRSRWRAVWWSMGILLTAYCTVPSKDGDTDAGELAALAAIAGQQAGDAEKAPPHHVNPWALPPKAPPPSGD